jgi:glutathione S-transferase
LLTLYGFIESGNVYKVRLLLAQLGIPHRRVEVSQITGSTADPRFRVLNPTGKVPAIRFDDGSILSESGAILFYLDQGTAYWPVEPWQQAQVLRWMFFEQYSHEPYIAVNRNLLSYTADRSGSVVRIAENAKRGQHALDVMERHLAADDWFAADCYTIADIALYAYTHVAGEGGFDLATFPAIRRWLARVEKQPGHVRLLEETSALPPMSIEEAARSLA